MNVIPVDSVAAPPPSAAAVDSDAQQHLFEQMMWPLQSGIAEAALSTTRADDDESA